MKLITPIPTAATFLLAAALAGCAAAPGTRADHSHAEAAPMDMQAHWGMHGKMMAGKPSAEQHAMMQEHMKAMTPEMRQRMQAMHDPCK